jgi:hypothetical protein
VFKQVNFDYKKSNKKTHFCSFYFLFNILTSLIEQKKLK